MSLNIKNPEAHKLAQELADKTGESLTTTVTVALRERLNRLRSGGDPGRIATQLLAIGRRCAATARGKRVSHATLLYDSRGLPK